MAKTLAQLVALLRTELKTDPNGKIWDSDTVDAYINDAYFQVQSDGLFAWPGCENGSGTITTVAGTQEADLPSLFGQVELVLNSSTELFPDDFKNVKIRNPLNVQGTPTYYYIRGTKMGFDPVPSSALSITVYFRKILAALATSSTEMGLTDDFAPAIVKYAAYLAWSSPRGNIQEAEYKITDYQRELTKLRNAYQLRDLTAINYRSIRNSVNSNYPDRIYY